MSKARIDWPAIWLLTIAWSILIPLAAVLSVVTYGAAPVFVACVFAGVYVHAKAKAARGIQWYD